MREVFFLASRGLGALPKFLERAGVAPGTEAVWIPTAANAISGAGAIREHVRADLSGLFPLRELDLDRHDADAIRQAKVILVSGGDPFHLLSRMKAPRVFTLLKAAMARGVPYIGISAGAIVVGPSLEPYGQALAGLSFVDVVVLPHAQRPDRVVRHAELIRTLGERMSLLAVRDDQAVVVDSGAVEIVAS